MTIEEYFSQWERVAGLGVLVAVFIGVAVRRKRSIHPPLMFTCFLADLGLVLYLEFNRHAIETASSHMSTTMITHISIASLSLLLYIVLTISGLRILAGGGSKTFHRYAGIFFLVVRVAVQITATMVATSLH